MTRHVYPGSEVIHLWAHGTDHGLRNSSGNVFTLGNVIYSYGRHFPIAMRLEVPQSEYHVQGKYGKTWEQETVEESYRDALNQLRTYRENCPETSFRVKRVTVQRPVFLVSDRSYSVTTSKHQSWVRGAIPGDAFTVSLDPIFWNGVRDRGHGGELRKLFRERVRQALEDANNKRMGYHRRNAGCERAQRAASQFNTLHKLFRFRVRNLIEVPELPDLTESWTRQTERDALKEVRRRERWERWERERKEAEELRQRELAEVKANLPSIIESWRNGERMPYQAANLIPFPIVRVLGDTLETSLGARVPVSEVRDFVQSGRLAYIIQRAGFRFDHFAIGPYRGITATVDALKIGCHVFPWAEVRDVLVRLGLPTDSIEDVQSV